MNILLVGNESAGIQTLRLLARSGHRVVAVMTPQPEADGSQVTLWNVAGKLGLPTWPARLVRDPSLASTLRQSAVDLVLNVHALHVIHPTVLAAARLGCFNLHPGPLPRYAGLNAVSWAIYRGEKTHGVTLHWMEPAIDAGPIAYQTLFAIDDEDTALSLSSKCVKTGIPLIERLLGDATGGAWAIPRIQQDLSRREYFGRERPSSPSPFWNRTARDVVDHVRACDYFPFPSPWGYPRARIGDREVAVARVRRTGQPARTSAGTVGRVSVDGIEVACTDEWVTVCSVWLYGRYVAAAMVFRPGDPVDGSARRSNTLLRKSV